MIMADVDKLIAEYKAAKLNEKGESDEKLEVILELEDHEDEKVIPFFLNVLLNEEEYDLARIEILKILKLRDAQSQEEHNRIGKAILQVLMKSSDPDVRNYAAMAMSKYMDVEGANTEAGNLLLNSKTDINLRHNLLAAFERFGPTEPGREVLLKLLQDEELRQAAARVLGEWGSK
jgi:HEAT repeat protein